MWYLRMTCKHTSEFPSRLLIPGHGNKIQKKGCRIIKCF